MYITITSATPTSARKGRKSKIILAIFHISSFHWQKSGTWVNFNRWQLFTVFKRKLLDFATLYQNITIDEDQFDVIFHCIRKLMVDLQGEIDAWPEKCFLRSWIFWLLENNIHEVIFTFLGHQSIVLLILPNFFLHFSFLTFGKDQEIQDDGSSMAVVFIRDVIITW